MVKTNKAFTLIEVLLSMIIIMIITATIVPVLSKAKPKIETVTMRGQYACYVENGELKEQYMDERTARKPAQTVSECVLKLDQRPAKYYILASGAGKNGTQAQVQTTYIPAFSSDLKITLGRMNNNGVTTIKSDESTTGMTVVGGESYSRNTIVPGNIESCSLLSYGEPCPNVVGQIQQSCEVKLTEDEGVKIRINGCENFNSGDVNASRANLFNPGYFSYVGSKPLLNTNSDIVTINNVATPDNGHYEYNNIKVNFMFKDSSFSVSNKDESKMSQIIENVPIQRKSALTDKIKDLKAGAPNKDGAVLILW